VPKTEDWRKLGASDEEKAYLDGIELDETDREMVAAAE
jgi:phthalate 4,5-dioxygenase oxygenase subunit